MRSGCIAPERRHTAGDAGYWPTPEKRRTPEEQERMRWVDRESDDSISRRRQQTH